MYDGCLIVNRRSLMIPQVGLKLYHIRLDVTESIDCFVL